MSNPSGGEWNQRLSEAGDHVARATHRLREFWARVTEGLEVQELWSQIRADARASYHLYSKEVDLTEWKGEPRWKRRFRIGRALFWAMLMKLTPARRVLLLIALLMLLFPSATFEAGQGRTVIQFESSPLHVVGGRLLFLLM